MSLYMHKEKKFYIDMYVVVDRCIYPSLYNIYVYIVYIHHI